MNKRLVFLTFAGAVLAGLCSALVQAKEVQKPRPKLKLIIGGIEEKKRNDASSRR